MGVGDDQQSHDVDRLADAPRLHGVAGTDVATVSVLTAILGPWQPNRAWSSSASASTPGEDRIFALEPIRGDDRGEGRRTRVWVEGIPNPIVASRTERTILADMGQERAAQSFVIDEALELAERLAAAVDAGRVDLGDLGRRARHLLEAATNAAAERE